MKEKSIEEVLPEETLQVLDALGEVLLRIRRRMLSEGFDVVDGKVVPIKTKEIYSKIAGCKK